MKIKSALSLTALAVCAALSTSALAQNVVNFEGYVVETACNADAGVNGLVTLPSVPASSLATSGETTGQVDFPVALSGCKPGDRTYQINFSDASAVNGRLPNVAAGGATNVSLQLLSSIDQVLTVTDVPYGKVDAAIDPGIDTDATGSGNGVYKVRYYAEGAATSGEVKASATMTANVL